VKKVITVTIIGDINNHEHKTNVTGQGLECGTVHELEVGFPVVRVPDDANVIQVLHYIAATVHSSSLKSDHVV
jgi:hypothetical protein